MKNMVKNPHILKSFDLVELPSQDCSEVRLPSYEKLFPANWAGDTLQNIVTIPFSIQCMNCFSYVTIIGVCCTESFILGYFNEYCLKYDLA